MTALEVSRAGLGVGGKWAPANLHVVRSICNPMDRGTSPGGQSFTLALDDSYVVDGHDVVALIGEIQAYNAAESHFVAVTALLLLELEESVPNLGDEEQYRDLLKEASAWGSHLLWDYIAAQMRVTASGLLNPELDLPVMTPVPILLKRGGRERLDPEVAED